MEMDFLTHKGNETFPRIAKSVAIPQKSLATLLAILKNAFLTSHSIESLFAFLPLPPVHGKKRQ